MSFFFLLLACAAQEPIDWKTDYDAALGEAREKKKRAVVYFRQEGRPLCKSMEEETLARPEVARALRERFLAVKVDAEAGADLFRRLVGGHGALATCVVDGEGDVVSVLLGHADAGSYLRFLEKADRGYERLRETREAAARNPEDAAALYELAETYAAMDSPRRAEEHFDKVIALGSKAPEKWAALSHERKARCRALNGRNKEARIHVARCLELDPGNKYERLDRIRVSEALVLAIERRPAEAVGLLEEALKKFPQSGEADQMMFLLGVARHESGDDPRAIEILEQVGRKYPSSPLAPRAKEQIAHIKAGNVPHTH